MPKPPRGGFGGRFAVILSGELIQSLFHFVLNIALVRTLSQQDYGFFAIIFVCGAIALTYARAGVAVPATSFIARAQGRLSERAFDALFGTAAFVLCVAIMLIVSVVLLPVVGAARGLPAPSSRSTPSGATSGSFCWRGRRLASPGSATSSMQTVGIGSILYCTSGWTMSRPRMPSSP